MADAELQERLARLDKALGGRYPPKLPPPPKKIEEEVPKITRAEQLAALEAYEISQLPKPVHDPVLFAFQTEQVAKIRARELARANAPVQINGQTRTMASFEGDIPFDNRKGQPAPLGIKFVPFIAVTKWCYTYAPKHLLQPFATAFFDGDKIYARDWDL